MMHGWLLAAIFVGALTVLAALVTANLTHP